MMLAFLPDAGGLSFTVEGGGASPAYPQHNKQKSKITNYVNGIQKFDKVSK